jgi:hypothetical protein
LHVPYAGQLDGQRQVNAGQTTALSLFAHGQRATLVPASMITVRIVRQQKIPPQNLLWTAPNARMYTILLNVE